VVQKVDGADMDSLRSYADLIRDKVGSAILLLASTADNKVMLIAAATPDMVKAGFNAGNLLKKVAPIVGGGGGGRPGLAQAGGKEPGAIDKALEEGWKEIREMLGVKA